jgi:hypothetical protein
VPWHSGVCATCTELPCPHCLPCSCSGVGTCKKGCCICQTGYGGLDCSNSGASSNALALPNTIIPGYYTYGPIEIGMGLQIYWVLLNCGPLPYASVLVGVRLCLQARLATE